MAASAKAERVALLPATTESIATSATAGAEAVVDAIEAGGRRARREGATQGVCVAPSRRALASHPRVASSRRSLALSLKLRGRLLRLDLFEFLLP